MITQAQIKKKKKKYTLSSSASFLKVGKSSIPGERCNFPPFLYAEMPKPITSSEGCKALIWHTWGSCDELK